MLHNNLNCNIYTLHEQPINKKISNRVNDILLVILVIKFYTTISDVARGFWVITPLHCLFPISKCTVYVFYKRKT